MKPLVSYIIQAGGFVAAAIGLIMTFRHPEITALLLFGGLAWFIGGYIRNRGLI